MPRFKDQAICIRHFDWSQTSQVVVLLTEKHGLLRGVAKGSRRMSPSSVARFSGGIELLTLGQVLAATRPTAELAGITEWDLQNDYFVLRRDLDRHRLAMYAADLCGAFYLEHDPHPGAFAALRSFLDAIESPAPAGLLLRFQWALLDDAGFRPELRLDVDGGDGLPRLDAYTFDPRAGGLTARNGLEDWRVRASTVDLLRRVADGGSPDADIETITRANRLLCAYARFILDRELPTMPFVL